MSELSELHADHPTSHDVSHAANSDTYHVLVNPTDLEFDPERAEFQRGELDLAKGELRNTTPPAESA